MAPELAYDTGTRPIFARVFAVNDPRINIEEQIAFIERHVEQLDTVVRGLVDDLGRLQNEFARLRLEIQGRLDDLDPVSENEVPPAG